MRTLLLSILFSVICIPVLGQELPPMDEEAEEDQKQRHSNVQRKDPAMGMLFGALILGGGHFYAGEGGRGALLLLGGAASVGIGYAASSCETTGTGLQTETECNFTPLYLGLLANGVAWVISIVDGGNAVERYNARNDLAIGPVDVKPTVASVGSSTQYGVSVGLQF